MTTEDLLLEFMAKVNNALSLDDDALRLRAVRQAKHWAEEAYAALALAQHEDHSIEDTQRPLMRK